MTGPLDGPLDIDCPECGRKVKTTIQAARRSPTLRCSNGHSIKVDGAQFDREAKRIEKALKGLGGR